MRHSELRTLVERNTVTACDLDLCHLTAVPDSAKQRVIHHLFVAYQGGSIIYAIELLVFLQYNPPHIYVSKVDTTGCHEAVRSPIAGLTRAILQYVVTGLKMSVRLCLFARAQPQYIFPCSSQNEGKHIIGDSALLKWWIRILENLRVQYHDRQSLGFLVMPGADNRQSSRYLPNSEHWQVGYPHDLSALASEVIPMFPDDPKARLLEDLKLDNQVHTTVSHFWELMNCRQEMCLGHAIAFVMLDLPIHGSASVLIEHSSDQTSSIDYKIYRRLFDSLQSSTYSDVQETKVASQQWISLVRTHCPNNLHQNIQGQAQNVTNVNQVVNSEQVNVLIPRKRKKDSQGPLPSESSPTSRKKISPALPNVQDLC